MVLSEQLSSKRQVGEHAAKQSLRRQLERLERELSQIVVAGYPYIRAGTTGANTTAAGGGSTAGGAGTAPTGTAPTGAVPTGAASNAALQGPHLLSLGELERQRDALVQSVREARARTARRAECERRARARFEGMRLEPGRYKFARLNVADLGEGGCGVWQVRPRLGLLGMLAGWWELKLSSGCP
jgi:hypothetical protein